jgi:hypothetical protein
MHLLKYNLQLGHFESLSISGCQTYNQALRNARASLTIVLPCPTLLVCAEFRVRQCNLGWTGQWETSLDRIQSPN